MAVFLKFSVEIWNYLQLTQLTQNGPWVFFENAPKNACSSILWCLQLKVDWLIILPDQNVTASDVHSHPQADLMALCLGCVGSSKPDEDILAFADDVSKPIHFPVKQ